MCVNKFFLPFSSDEELPHTLNIPQKYTTTEVEDTPVTAQDVQNIPTNTRAKSSRSVHRPSHLQDYICNHTSTQYWCNMVEYCALSNSHLK